MSEEKFTLGNWKVSDQREIPNMNYDYSIVDDGGWYIAHIENCSLEEQEANAHLIAAAPEMYRVLSGICFEKSARICNYAPESCKVCFINKALKKARGEK